nr:CbiX/SirB N-terminal domain-containing protein [Synechococcus elongatus]
MSTLRILVAHGSRDPRSAIALQQLATELASRLGSEPAIAFLEGPHPPLAEQIVQLAQQEKSQGAIAVQIYPLFLLAGTHTTEDLPAAVTTAQEQLRISVALQSAWGESSSLRNLLRSQVQPQTETWLLAHGSRRSAANQRIEQLSAEFGWSAVFCRAEPFLGDRLADSQPQRILPLLLFPGPIYDSVQDICVAANATACLAPPLSQWPLFLDAIAQWLQVDVLISDNRASAPTRFPQKPGELGRKSATNC